MSTSLAVQQEAISPMQVLQQAVAAGANVDQLTQLLALQERWEANEAKKAFNVAFSAFKAEAITIVRNITVTDGPLKGKRHADLFGVVSVITPALSKHGLSASWKLTKDEKDWMEVTCTIRHILGYSEPTSMGAAPDTGPGRNAIQARGSAKTYLERYTLLAAIGMAASGQDDDGRAAGGAEGKPGMPLEDFDSHLTLIEEARTKDELTVAYKAAYKDAHGFGDQAAIAQFIKAKDKAKRLLEEAGA